MEKVNVLEFITSMGEGGAQNLVKDYALNIDKSMFDVRILCLYPMLDSGPGKKAIRAGVSITSIYPRYSKFWSLINKLVGRWVVPIKLMEEINEFHPSVIHSHLAVLRYLVPIRQNLPEKVFYTCHNQPMKNFVSTKSKEFILKYKAGGHWNVSRGREK